MSRRLSAPNGVLAATRVDRLGDDADGKKLTLDTEGPDMEEEGKLARYHEAIEFKSNDERVFTSHVLHDGGWRP